jgi:hypothetical protein
VDITPVLGRTAPATPASRSLDTGLYEVVAPVVLVAPVALVAPVVADTDVGSST